MEYEMTEEELQELNTASKPTPAMWTSNGTLIGGTPQANANRFWARLASKYGFEPMSPRPIDGKGPRFFTANPRGGGRSEERLG